MADIEFQPKNNGVPLWIGGIVLFLVVCWLLGTLRVPEKPAAESEAPVRAKAVSEVRGASRPALSASSKPAVQVEVLHPVVSRLEGPLSSVVVGASDAEAYRRLLELAASQGWKADRLDALRSVRLRLDAKSLSRLASELGDAIQTGEDAQIQIPRNLRDEYPEWEGNPGPAFGRDYRAYLGVDTSDSARGRGVTVALLDTAVLPHPALKDALMTTLDPCGIAERDGKSCSDHGTAVASILTGALGVTNASVRAYAVLDAEGNGSVFDAARALVAAVDDGAKVVSMSFGTYSDSAVMANAVAYAQEKGAVLVAAAGNNGVNDICYPAAYEGVVAVGAVSADGNVAGFSNRGERVDVVAPGVGLLAATANDEAGLFTGTSAAVPCVSGILANYLAAHPEATAGDARRVLLENCNDTGLPGRDEASGSGIVDADRMNRHDAEGIVDVAAGGIELDEEGAIVVTLQNTGTVPMSGAALTAFINGREYSHVFKTEIAPGDSVAAAAKLSDADFSGTGLIQVRTSVSLPGREDQRSRNQTRVRTFNLNEGVENP